MPLLWCRAAAGREEKGGVDYAKFNACVFMFNNSFNRYPHFLWIILNYKRIEKVK